jgi:hypothetical protein
VSADTQPPEASDEPESEGAGDKPVRANWKALGIPAAAALAALMIWLFIPRSGRLPDYALELPALASHTASVGSAEGRSAMVELEPGLGLTLLLHPESAPTVPIEIRMFVVTGPGTDGAARPLEARTEAAGSGAVRLIVSSASLPEAGRLIVLIGREGALPGSPSTGSATHGHGWQRFDVSFTQPRATR